MHNTIARDTFVMPKQWSDDQPIYRQLQQEVSDLILRGEIAEGEALPSVRQLSADYRINHLTVAKAYQALVEAGLVEKRRGLGMFVIQGARAQLQTSEREQFLTVELPAFWQRAQNLGLSQKALMEKIKQLGESS